MQSRTCSACLVLLLLVGATGLRGQTYQGGLRGAVRDSEGGVIPSASITLTNEGTNAVRTTVTNNMGEYSFPNVQPGKYSIRAEMQGFNTYEQTGIEIGVQRFHVIDIRLEVGGITESITVTSESPILETATASRSASLESVELETLPSPARNPYLLSITTPNVIPSGNPQFQRMQDQWAVSALSIAGGPRRGNNYTIDGVPITDLENRAAIIPSIEAVEEVNVQVSTYDAEMGRTGGGVFNTLHKRGSNRWSGSAVLQNRPQWGIGQLYFAKEAGEPKPDSYYWLWGGSFGGPIIRDKTFFWIATEGYRTNVSRNRILTLPTTAEARGDFSQSGRIIYDPLSTRPDPNNPGQLIRDPFPGNVISPDRLNTVGLNLAAFLAERGSGRISASADVVDATEQLSFNINHQFSDKYTLSGTYMYYDSNEPFPLYLGGPSDNNLGDLYRQVNVVALNNTLIPNDDTVFTLRYGYMRFIDNWSKEEYNPAQLGFSQNYLDQITVNTFPRVSVEGYPTQGGGASNDFRYYSHAVNGTASKFIGSHTLKLGADYRRLGLDMFIPGRAAGSFDFDRGFTGGPNPNSPDQDSGDSLASLLLGFPASGYLPINTPRNVFINYFGAFIQDDWRISPDIVLNFGLRVEHETGLREKNNRQTVGFDREREWPVQPIEGMVLRGGLMYAGVDGYPEHQGDPTPVKWGPRAGLAWSLNEKTVIRGGYGVFWAPFQPTYEGARGYSAETYYFTSNDGGLTPAGTITDPFPDGIEQPAGSSLGLMTGAGGDVSFADQFRRSAYVQQFSAELQREVSGDVVVSVGYLGSRSDRLGLGGDISYPLNINQLDPKYFELGSALQEPVPNPFFGNPIFGNFSQRPTIARG